MCERLPAKTIRRFGWHVFQMLVQLNLPKQHLCTLRKRNSVCLVPCTSPGGAAGPGPCMRHPPAPPPPRVLKDSGAGSATNKCP